MEVPAMRGDLMESWRDFEQCRKWHKLNVRIIHKQGILGESVRERDVSSCTVGEVENVVLAQK